MSPLQHMCKAMDMVSEPSRATRKGFRALNALEQRVELGYFLMDHPDAMQEALSDCLNFKNLLTAWWAADTAKVWHLIDRALADALADRIDEENGYKP